MKGRGAESVCRGSRDVKEVRSPEFIAKGHSKPGTTHKYDHPSASVLNPCKVKLQNGISSSSSMIHPSAVDSWNKAGGTRNISEFRKQNTMKPQVASTYNKKDDRASNKDQASVSYQLFLTTSYHHHHHHRIVFRSSHPTYLCYLDSIVCIQC